MPPTSGSAAAESKEVELGALYTVFMEVMREKKLLQVDVAWGGGWLGLMCCL